MISPEQGEPGGQTPELDPEEEPDAGELDAWAAALVEDAT